MNNIGESISETFLHVTDSFSSQGQGSSIIVSILVDLERSNTSGRRVETAKNTGTTNNPSKSNSKFQSEAECNMPRKP